MMSSRNHTFRLSVPLSIAVSCFSFRYHCHQRQKDRNGNSIACIFIHEENHSQQFLWRPMQGGGQWTWWWEANIDKGGGRTEASCGYALCTFHPEFLTDFLAHSMCSVNNCWMNDLINQGYLVAHYDLRVTLHIEKHMFIVAFYKLT